MTFEGGNEGLEMEKSEKEKKAGTSEPKPQRRSTSTWLILLVLAAATILLFSNRPKPRSQVAYSFFLNELERGNIESARLIGSSLVEGRFKTTPQAPRQIDRNGDLVAPSENDGKPAVLLDDFSTRVPSGQGVVDSLVERLESKPDVVYDSVAPDTTYEMITTILLFAVLLGVPIFFFFMLRRTRNDMMGGGFLSGFSKSPAKKYEGAGTGYHLHRCCWAGRGQSRLARDC